MIRSGIPRLFRLAVRRRDRWERDVEDEIKLHLALRAEQLAAQGAAPDEAYREAVRRFGPLNESRARLLDAARHREQQMQRTEFFGDVRQDLSFALRTLGRQKGWAAITVLTLALGIGATTAVFSVVSSLLLHAVPYPAPDRVVIVEQEPSAGNNTGMHVSITPAPPIVNAWRDGNHTFETLEPYRSSTAALRTNGDPAQISATWILPSFVSFAGERPILGRLFSPAEMASHARVALLSESLWQSRYGGDQAVLGRTITIDDSVYTVIGVLPAALRTPSRGRTATDAWLPLDLSNKRLGLRVVGRLRAGATIGAARHDLDALSGRSGAYPPGKLPFVARISTPADLVDFREALLMLTAAVALVLLVACANVAHLMLSRTASRHRELAIRAALGAGRARLFRQLLTESLVLALTGAALGVFLGWIGLEALVALRPPSLVELVAARLDHTTLFVSVALAIASGVAFGVIGAVQSARHSTHESLKAGSLATSHSRRSDRLRSLLVVSEMALSATLIVGATLLVRSVVNLQDTDLGFNPSGVYAVSVTLPKSRYATPAARAAFRHELTSRLRVVPGIRDLAVAEVTPGSRSFAIGKFEVEGEAPSPASTETSYIDGNGVAPGYFTMMGIRLVEGTTFTDTSDAANQVVINAGYARSHWPSGGALGHRVRVAYQGNGTWKTIVGVAADAATGGPGSAPQAPMLYQPSGDSQYGTSVMIRTQGTADVVTPVRALIRSIDPQMTAPTIESTEQIVANSIAGPRFSMLLLTVFTLLALVLAAVGLYGVMAYSVAQRTREIGIRVALGAPRGAVARMVVARGVILACIGAALGLGGAYLGTRLIVKLLYGVAPVDALSFTTGAVVLILAALAACVVPTRRALGVDPIRAIRAD
ncbi:MAG: permease [Gemmatimonadetes bacterium]|nr:permease [Gemmatimonadota bacterium]